MTPAREKLVRLCVATGLVDAGTGERVLSGAADDAALRRALRAAGMPADVLARLEAAVAPDGDGDGDAPVTGSVVGEPPGSPAGPGGVPRRLGPYEILGLLGRGGMGAVFRARHTGLRRDVAVKVLLNPGSDDAVQRFLREARTTAKLAKHPHVVQVHDVGEQDGIWYIAMDLVEGGSLEALAATGTLDPRRAATIVEGIARGVAFAHAAGIIHRDLKPANVLIDHAGTPLVTDFGLARELGTDSRLSVTGQIVGTPAYMSPEQAEGRTAEIGPQSDVYGIGAILYDCLAGRVPFTGDGVMAVLRAVSAGDPDPPSRSRPSIPPELDIVTLKAMALLPSERYTGAAALADDLRRWLDGEGILARPLPFPVRAARRLARHRVALALTAAGIALASWGITAGARGRSERASHSAATREAELASRASRERSARVAGDVAAARAVLDSVARRADLLGSPASATLLFAAELEDARDRLRDALRDDPQNFEAHVLMARTLRPLLETDAARRAAEAALRLRPADPDALWEAILLDVHRFELAQGDAYDVDFSGTRTLGPVATVRYVESMSPEQHAALEKIRSDISALAAGLPPSRAAHARAFLQRLEGRYEDALASCEAALAEDPHLFEALRLRASILAALRRPEALAAHRVLSSVLPEDPFLLLTLADLEDSLPAGMLAIDRAERLFSSPDLARYHRATLLLRFDRPREAAAIARALTRENPLYGPNWEVLHVAGYLLGDWEEADAALVSWGEQGGQLQPIWWSVAGSRHAEMGRFGEAVEAFARAVEMAPGFAVCRWGLGRSRILNGEVARGVEDLFDAVAAGNLDDRARRALEAQRATMEKSVKKLKTPREQAKFAEGIAFLLRMSLAEDAPPERTEQYGASIATLHNLAFALYEKAGAWKDALRLIPTASLPGVDRPWMPDYRIARIEAAQGRAAQAAQALRAARDRGMESLGAVRGHPAFAAFLKSPEHAELEKEFAEPR